ncbi:MAG: NAD-binding protein [Proteobacteria bacterium]|nr:NAD-binding protein [Pseudomonadota bacterium]MBU1714992.1 NAD-binding protein [Pseudomonadota bacterium]
MKTIGVVGAGVMGVGVAQDLAQTGHKVLLIDLAEPILERAEREIRQNVRFQSMFKKDKKGLSPDQVIEQIRFTTDYNLLATADFIIENVTEKWELKREVYARLDAICPEKCLFASNTSAIPITRIGSATKRPSQVLGMHFMNPVPMKTMVEVIRGYHTSEETIETARQLLKSMNKECVIVNDSPGFVSNRVLMLTVNEAIFLVQDGVAAAEDVDKIFRSCFEHKMGPLETADLIGLDTILYSLEVLYDSFNDGKYRPCPLLKKMVDAGLHGRKSGKGFYPYQG